MIPLHLQIPSLFSSSKLWILVGSCLAPDNYVSKKNVVDGIVNLSLDGFLSCIILPNSWLYIFGNIWVSFNVSVERSNNLL